jgi:hypothetical protein
LLAGLDLVAARIAAGTFDDMAPVGSSPPSQTGQLTPILASLDAELSRRKAPR